MIHRCCYSTSGNTWEVPDDDCKFMDKRGCREKTSEQIAKTSARRERPDRQSAMRPQRLPVMTEGKDKIPKLIRQGICIVSRLKACCLLYRRIPRSCRWSAALQRRVVRKADKVHRRYWAPVATATFSPTGSCGDLILPGSLTLEVYSPAVGVGRSTVVAILT